MTEDVAELTLRILDEIGILIALIIYLFGRFRPVP